MPDVTKQVLPVLELSELPKDLSKYVFYNTVVGGKKEVNQTLLELGVKQEQIINDFPISKYQDTFSRWYCKKYEIELSDEVLAFHNTKIHNVLLEEDKSLHQTFWGTFADEIMPPLYHDTLLTIDGPYEDDDNVVIEEQDYVLDVGANLGLFSCYAASKGCHVYACDPDTKCLNILKKQQELYPDNIEIIPIGLSDKCGVVDFFESTDCGISSIYMPRGQVKKTMIEIDTIDQLVEKGQIKQVDFIKADIEGGERYMLAGAKKTLQRFAPKLSICTYHYKDDPQVLEKIIKSANPDYVVSHRWRKLYAYVPR